MLITAAREWRESVRSQWDLVSLGAAFLRVRSGAKARRVDSQRFPQRDSSGTLWRIPHDWRRRRIRLPSYDVLVSQDILPEVAQEYGGKNVSVNYHPGSLCCLPDGYRFRDRDGNRWEVKALDCVLLGYGDEPEYSV